MPIMYGAPETLVIAADPMPVPVVAPSVTVIAADSSTKKYLIGAGIAAALYFLLH